MIEMLDNLKERPHHERKAIALWVTVGIVVVLFLGWAIFFFQRIQNIIPAPQPQQPAATSTASANVNSELQIIPVDSNSPTY